MAKKEFLMLAHKYEPRKHLINGWIVSEKLDGIRAFWDGGITRGMRAKEISFANTLKDDRLLIEPVATGLWSRYGKVIHAPDWWLDQLPDIPLDGELWYNEGWQELSKIVKRMDKSGDWSKVEYFVFDSPNLDHFGIEGKHFKNSMVGDILKYLRDRIGDNQILQIHEQMKLSLNSKDAERELNNFMGEILDSGGEGVMLRNPNSFWTPERSKNLLKFKGINDAEGIVVGMTSGKGKLFGLFGALIINFNGKRLELSGFTDEERKLTRSCCNEPEGKELGMEYDSIYFPRGSVVSFKYRELSDSGIPKEARYWRKRA